MLNERDRGLLAVSVLTAAEEDPAFAKELITQIVEDHEGPELIFGLAASSWQLLRWLGEVSGRPVPELLEKLSASFAVDDDPSS